MEAEAVIFCFSEEKNEWLKRERGVSFEEVILCIQNGQVLDVKEHPNKTKYSDQQVLIVEMNNYAYQVPFTKESNTVVLKTIFPSRKATKFYL